MIRLRGTAVDGEKVEFKIEDCPVRISETKIALLGKPMSKILDIRSITRGNEWYFEGDVIVDAKTDKELGIVIYAGGFYLHTNADEIKDIPPISHIKVREGNEKSISLALSYESTTKLGFGYKGNHISLKSFITKVGEFVALEGIVALVRPSDIHIFTGLYSDVDGRPLYFDEEYRGGTVLLDGNRVCVVWQDGLAQEL